MPDGFIETPNTIRMTLLFNPENGQFNVSGPIDNKLLAYGMLKLAEETIYNYNHAKEAAAASHITLPFPIRRTDT